MRAVKKGVREWKGDLLGFWWNEVGLLGSRDWPEGSLGSVSEEACLTSSSSTYSASYGLA